MRLNDDLSKPVIVHAGRMDWVPSPAAGVDRRMLFRIGGEVARATSARISISIQTRRMPPGGCGMRAALRRS